MENQDAATINTNEKYKCKFKIYEWVSWKVIRYGKYGRKVSWIVKRHGKHGRKESWIVINLGNYGRNPSWIVKRFGKYGTKLWNDMENIEEK